MLHSAFSCGLASSTIASMRSLPVMKAPSLPLSARASSSRLKMRSCWFDSTSKVSARRASKSGKIARATRIWGFMRASGINQKSG